MTTRRLQSSRQMQPAAGPLPRSRPRSWSRNLYPLRMDTVPEVVAAAYSAIRNADAAMFLATLDPTGRAEYLHWLRTSVEARAELESRWTLQHLDTYPPMDGTDADLVQGVLHAFAPFERQEVPELFTIVSETPTSATIEFYLNCADNVVAPVDEEALTRYFAEQGIESVSSLAELGIPPFTIQARRSDDGWKLIPLSQHLIPLTGYGDVMRHIEIEVEEDE